MIRGMYDMKSSHDEEIVDKDSDVTLLIAE